MLSELQRGQSRAMAGRVHAERPKLPTYVYEYFVCTSMSTEVDNVLTNPSKNNAKAFENTRWRGSP